MANINSGWGEGQQFHLNIQTCILEEDSEFNFLKIK